MAAKHLIYLPICALLAALWTGPEPVSAAKAKILIYSATTRFRHDSIPTAVSVLNDKGSTIGVEFDNTEDQSFFTDENLQKYDALLFLSTTGEGESQRLFGAVSKLTDLRKYVLLSSPEKRRFLPNIY